MCLMFWKTYSASHCFCLKPTTQCTFTEPILCSILYLNVYNVWKNFFWKTLLLLEAHHAVYFHRMHTLLNCMFECVYCFENFFWKTLLPLEAHHPLYFHRALSLFNCMFACIKCFEKNLLKSIACAWSPPATVLSQSA